MGPGKTGLAGSLHKPLRVPGGKREKVAAGYYSPASLGRGGGQQGAKARPLSRRGNGPHLPEGSRAARDSVGWVAGPGSTTKWRRPLCSFWPEMQSPEVAAGLKPHSPEIRSFQLPPETGKLLTARGCLPARGDSFAKSNGGFQRVRFFLEPSSHSNPIKNHLGASELPQASPKVS